MPEVYRLIAAGEIECCRGAAKSAAEIVNRANKEKSRQEVRLKQDYFFRWRIFERMRRFLRPSFRRPFPDLFVPKAISELKVHTQWRIETKPRL
jgi:hypothetical protein